jgi:Domain of Unknown Function (DUF1206)
MKDAGPGSWPGMRTTSSPARAPRSRASSRASRQARRAADSPAVRGLARVGLAARGVIYLLIGWVALLVAFGHTSHAPNQEGALQLVASKPYGLVSLWLLGIGFAGYSIWRLSEAVFGVTGDGSGAGPRLKSLCRAVVYAFFAYLTFKTISGVHSNPTRQQQDLTAQVMQHSGGRWLVGIAGLVVVIIGAVLVVEGIRRKFMKYLLTGQMSPRVRKIIERLGMIGTISRGVVFAIVGALIIDAAMTAKASKSGGLDKALLTLRHQDFGPWLLGVVALGLIIFGVYGLCEARWRRV